MILSPLAEQIITLVIAVLLGLIGMKPIDWLKRQFSLADEPALIFVWVIAGAVGVLGLLGSGMIFEMEFTLENVLSIAGVFGAAAKFAYEAMKSRSTA